MPARGRSSVMRVCAFPRDARVNCRSSTTPTLPRMDRALTDEELMLAYRAGDAAAFDILYMRHKGAVFRYLRRQTGTASVAEELFQDIWLRLIDARLNYEPRAKFTTWLFSIAHNRLMDHFRRASRAALVSYDDQVGLVEELAAT